MKKLGILILCLLCLFAVQTFAHMVQPYDASNRVYTDIDFYGVDYKIVSDTSAWTTVFGGKGIVYAIYFVADSTYTTNINYMRASDTNTVVIPDLYVNPDSTRTGKNISDAIQYLPSKPIYCPSGFKVKPGPQTEGVHGTSNPGETKIFILKRSR